MSAGAPVDIDEEKLRRVRDRLRGGRQGKSGSGKPDGHAAGNAGPSPDGARGRKEVRLLPDRWNEAMAECAGLIGDVAYLRGTVLMMLARAEDAGGRGVGDGKDAAVELDGVVHRPGSLVFMEASPGRVAWLLDERAAFARHSRTKGDWTPARCPKDLAASLVEAAVYLGMRPCAGIVHVPMLVDGKVVATPGYHAGTGLILDLHGPSPVVPAILDEEVARAALDRLLRPFRGYLGAKTAEPAAVAAAVLTSVLRPSLRTAPAIVVDGNGPGTGKGKFGRALSAINAGTHPAVITEGHSDEETEKRIATAVLQGAAVILFDNLQRHVASSTLESLLTEPVADIRVFGRLSSIRVACRSLIVLTANNCTLRADMLRRTLPVRLVVPDDRPEARPFDFDPVEEATRDRTDLLSAAFTVAMAWLRVRDLPENARHRRSLGSFEQWADVVAGAVSWLTGTNPIDLIETRKDEDPRAADERRAIAALVAEYDDEKWSAKQAAEEVVADVWAGVIRFKGERPTAGDVSYWLRKRKDRAFKVVEADGSSTRRTLTNELDRKGVALWSLPGMPGIAGDDRPPTREIFEESENPGERGGNIPGDPRHPRRSSVDAEVELRDEVL